MIMFNILSNELYPDVDEIILPIYNKYILLNFTDIL